MKNIEEQIWEYVSGNCSPDEKKVLETLMEKDPAYRILFDEIKALHLQLNQLELDEPSMSFERNLMEQIEAEPLPGKSALVDVRIIRGIAGFFLLSILCLLGWAFYLTNWTGASFSLEMPKINWETYFSRPMVMAFLFFDMVVGLYFIDYWIRNKHTST